MKDIVIVIIPSILAGIGFITRYFWERHIKYTYDIESNTKEQLHNRLQKFYYPLYFNLERLTSLWTIKHESNESEINEDIMAIHCENQDIIKHNIVKAKPVPKLLHELLRYDKHVTIFRSLRKRSTKPREFDAEYPEHLKNTIKHRIDVLEDDMV